MWLSLACKSARPPSTALELLAASFAVLGFVLGCPGNPGGVFTGARGETSAITLFAFLVAFFLALLLDARVVGQHLQRQVARTDGQSVNLFLHGLLKHDGHAR